jgi:hypothetical protein
VPDPQRPRPLDDAPRRGAAALAVVALFAIVGMGAAGALHDDPDADRTVASAATFPLLVLLGAAAAAAVITTLMARRRMARDPEDDVDADEAKGSRWLRFAILLLPLAIVGALIFAIAVRPAGDTRSQPAAEAPSALPPVDAGGGGNPWQIVAFAAGAVGVAGAFGYGAWRTRIRRRPGVGPRRPPTADPAAAVDDALDALDRETDPRRAIIAAYVRMERALDRAGLGRREHEVPREYLARVTGALRGDARAARRLTALYEEARFSVHPMDEGMRADAVEALRALRAEGAP